MGDGSMRTIKRLLLSAEELGIVILGPVLTVVLAVLVSDWNPRAVDLVAVVLLSGLLLTPLSFLWVRRKHAPQKFAYDVAGWALDQVERKLHPRRRKWKRILAVSLVSLPSALAAFVLFFFPVASHLQHPSSHYFQHYRIPIPSSVAVFFPSGLDGGDKFRFLTGIVSSNPWGRFGMTTFWDRESLSAITTYGIRYRGGDAGNTADLYIPRDATDVLRRDFRANAITLTCWQWRAAWYTARFWTVTCRAPVDAYQQQFEASFYGREESIPSFYEIVDGVAFVR